MCSSVHRPNKSLKDTGIAPAQKSSFPRCSRFKHYSALILVIFVVSSAVGCATSRRSTSAMDATGAAVGSSHHPNTIRAPQVVLNAAQVCRENLRRIQGAKEQWALENRKQSSLV